MTGTRLADPSASSTLAEWTRCFVRSLAVLAALRRLSVDEQRLSGRRPPSASPRLVAQADRREGDATNGWSTSQPPPATLCVSFSLAVDPPHPHPLAARHAPAFECTADGVCMVVHGCCRWARAAASGQLADWPSDCLSVCLGLPAVARDQVAGCSLSRLPLRFAIAVPACCTDCCGHFCCWIEGKGKKCFAGSGRERRASRFVRSARLLGPLSAAGSPVVPDGVPRRTKQTNIC